MKKRDKPWGMLPALEACPSQEIMEKKQITPEIENGIKTSMEESFGLIVDLLLLANMPPDRDEKQHEMAATWHVRPAAAITFR